MNCFTLPPSGNAVPASFLLDSGNRDFPAAFSAHSGFPENRILLTASGASAFYLALRGLSALNPDRRGVVVPAWCCPSVAQSVLQAGLEPILADLDPSTLGYDGDSLEAARRRGPLAVLLVHFFGSPQPMPPGQWSGTAFVRDCAQDMEYRHDPGDPAAACFYSFGRGKALNAGHGGALCVSAEGPLSEACREAMESLPESRERPLPKALAINLLSQPRLFWALSRMPFLGIGTTVWKAHLSLERAAPGFGPLGTACLEAYLQRREYYRRLTAGYRALIGRCDPERIRLPASGGAHAGLPTRFPLLVRDQALREGILREVNGRFGGVTSMYPDTMDRLPGAPARVGGGREFPGGRRVAGEILTLPVTAELMGRELAFFDCLMSVLEGHGALTHRPAEKGSLPPEDWAPAAPFTKRPALFPAE